MFGRGDVSVRNNGHASNVEDMSEWSRTVKLVSITLDVR